ncbi:DUF2267 domain-containing protein [Synechocystis sp. PCC 7509]|uniref:DUF2267 domain-containing protein n=1 Tax=Synechocystis sp. PCC 7509 TaxID=927677 RepID=UPI0002AC38BC|nr:DUF2267 domain-containing protein [Synechocystis sp. PCC 7509]
MKYDEFIKHVQTIAQLNSKEAAQTATSATLETLKERIVGDEAGQLAAQLPKELGQYLHGREGENGGTFGVNEFLQRVSQKAGVDTNTAITHVKAVFAVLKDAVSPGEFDDVRVNLSDDYQDLLPAS